MPQVIELTEWEKRQVFLTKTEFRSLLSIPKIVSLVPSQGDEEWVIRAKNIVGTVTLPEVQLLIRPKVSLQNLFHLMGYRPDLVNWTAEEFNFDTYPDLLRILGWVFDRQLRKVLPSGLHRDYVSFQEPLTTVRGRIDVSAQIRKHSGLPMPIECRFDELTEDIVLNRVTRACLRKLLGVVKDFELTRNLRFWLRSFNSVSEVGFPSHAIPRPTFTRLNERWEVVFDLATLILSNEGIRDRQGGVVGASFTLDMNKLFEKFVEGIFEREARRAGWTLQAQGERSMSDQITLKPDFLLTRGGRDFAVADAKYKQPEEKEIKEQDVYQLHAYCSSLGLSRGLLIYAAPGVHESHVVHRAGIELQVTGVDLSGSPDEIEASVRAGAQHLIRAAEHELGRRAA